MSSTTQIYGIHHQEIVLESYYLTLMVVQAEQVPVVVFVVASLGWVERWRKANRSPVKDYRPIDRFHNTKI